jgi:hypothetical protein
MYPYKATQSIEASDHYVCIKRASPTQVPDLSVSSKVHTPTYYNYNKPTPTLTPTPTARLRLQQRTHLDALPHGTTTPFLEFVDCPELLSDRFTYGRERCAYMLA